jgi:hypothetical protein
MTSKQLKNKLNKKTPLLMSPFGFALAACGGGETGTLIGSGETETPIGGGETETPISDVSNPAGSDVDGPSAFFNVFDETLFSVQALGEDAAILD